MAEVPYNSGVPTVAPAERPPEDYQHIDARPEQFGALIARGEQQAGQGLEKASGAAFDYEQFQQSVQSDAALNNVMEGGQRIVEDYQKLRGIDARQAEAETKKQVDELWETQRSALKSDWQRQQFDRAGRPFKARYIDGMIRSHAVQQDFDYSRAVNQKTIDNSLSLIPNVANDEDEVKNHIADAGLAALKNSAIVNGFNADPAVLNADRKKEEAKGYKIWIDAVAAHDPVKAEELSEKYKKELGELYFQTSEQVQGKSEQIRGQQDGRDEFYRTTGQVVPERDLSGGARYRGAPLENVQGFIFHHTSGEGTAQGVVDTLNQRGLGVQYIMDRDGKIYRALPAGTRGAHMQTGSGAGAGLSNANTEGMEIIAKDDKDVTPAQVAAAKVFAARYEQDHPGIKFYGHGEVNPGHKEADEGHTVTEAVRAQQGGGGEGSSLLATGKVRGSTFNDVKTASGQSAATTAGIALPASAGGKMGDLYEITTPDGRKFTAPLIDRGPAAWTGRGVDVSAPLAKQMGYDKDFPTDAHFTVRPLAAAGGGGGGSAAPAAAGGRVPLTSPNVSDEGAGMLRLLQDPVLQANPRRMAAAQATYRQFWEARNREGAESRAAFNQRERDANAEALDRGTIRMTEADFYAALPPDQAAARWKSYLGNAQLGQDKSSFATMTPQSMQAFLDQMRPQEGEEGYEAALGRRQIAQQAMNEVVTERNRDPALFMLTRTDAGKAHWQAWQTIDKNPQSTPVEKQKAAEGFAEWMLEEQRRMGVEQPAILPKNLVADLQATVMGATTPTGEKGPNRVEGAVNTIEGLAKAWGRYWPDVYRQINKDAGPLFEIVGAGVKPAAAKALIENAHLSMQEILKNEENPDTTIKTLTKAVDQELKDFYRTLSGDRMENTRSNARNLATKLAAIYMNNTTGMTVEKPLTWFGTKEVGGNAANAARQAVTDLITHKYDFRDTYRVPNWMGLNADQVQAGAAEALRQLNNPEAVGGLLMTASPPNPNFPGQSPENGRAEYAMNLRASGRWLTNADEGQGLVLYKPDGNPAMRADGEIIRLSWPELEQLGRDRGAQVRMGTEAARKAMPFTGAQAP